MKPRVVVSYEEDEFAVMEHYARSKGLDPKTFLKFAGQTYMDKYPRSSGKNAKAVQPYASEGK